MLGASDAVVFAAENAETGMTLVDWLSSAGVGALIAGVLVAIINGVFSRGGKRADAAKALIDANQGFTATVTGQYEKVIIELVELKKAVQELTESVDDVLPLLNGNVGPTLKTRLQAANRAAKLVS